MYVCGEEVAGNGANEITSCFYADLKNCGYLQKGLKLFHLVFIADNCGGQNKNKTMTRFCMWLVECGYAIKVAPFLVKGLTKNIRDPNVLVSCCWSLSVAVCQPDMLVLHLKALDV